MAAGAGVGVAAGAGVGVAAGSDVDVGACVGGGTSVGVVVAVASPPHPAKTINATMAMPNARYRYRCNSRIIRIPIIFGFLLPRSTLVFVGERMILVSMTKYVNVFLESGQSCPDI